MSECKRTWMKHEMYINKVWLGGVVQTHPRIRNISERTKLTSFSVSVLETWESRDGEARSHRNDVVVEVLGKDADEAYKRLAPGSQVYIDGYLRSEVFKGRQQIKVRVFNIAYMEGSDARDEPETDGGKVARTP